MKFESPKNNSAESAPPQFPKGKRPEGEYYARPYQENDGQWYDGEGNKITQDQAYTIAWWHHQKSIPKNPERAEKFTETVEKTMKETIEKSSKGGTLHVFVDPKGLVTDYDKMHLSAFRELAREMGYEVGQFKFNKTSFVASASIHKMKR